MAYFHAELRLWTMKNSFAVKGTDIGCFHYHEKGEAVPPTSDFFYLEDKQRYAESRNYTWVPKNKRPEKLRETLKDLEELLQGSRCVDTRWRSKHCCQMLMSSGMLVTLFLVGADLDRVVIDKALVGRLPADTIWNGVLMDAFLLATFVEKARLSYVSLGAADRDRKQDKISTADIKVSSVDLPAFALGAATAPPGGPSRRVEWHVCVNAAQDLAACWWAGGGGGGGAGPGVQGACPWSPVATDWDRANLLLLCCAVGRLEVLSWVCTDGEPLDVRFSSGQPYQLCTVERPWGSATGSATADACLYECTTARLGTAGGSGGSWLQRVCVTTVPLPAPAISCSWGPGGQHRLLLGCADSQVVLYDASCQLSLVAQAEVRPEMVAWHPAGGVVAVASCEPARVQCLDAALTPLSAQAAAEEPAPVVAIDLSQWVRSQGGLARLEWAAAAPSAHASSRPEPADSLFVLFCAGPLGVLDFKPGVLSGGRLGAAELLHEHLRRGRAGAAVGLLASLSWDSHGPECLAGLTAVADRLLRQPLTPDTEALLESALGTFYAPRRAVADSTVLAYRDALCHYARRFFHHLLRYQQFEKAFLLAIDIGARDLFMDIHFAAAARGELALAAVARRKADEVDADSITAGVETVDLLDRAVCDETGRALPAPPSGRVELPGLTRAVAAERSRTGPRHYDTGGSLRGGGGSGKHGLEPAEPSASRKCLSPPLVPRPVGRKLGAELSCEPCLQAYAAALLEDPAAWARAGAAGVDGQELGSEVSVGGHAMGTLQVVHLGLV
ncbi:WD repeat-containing and planar cell polarity effector protein fritz homolog isoform X1 [Lampetra fluviatilis]